MTTTLQTADTALAAAGLPTHTAIIAGATADLATIGAPGATLLRAELEDARAAANRQNIIAGRVADRLRNERDQLQRVLRAVRAMIDSSQPKDLPGAIMAIDAALKP